MRKTLVIFFLIMSSISLFGETYQYEPNDTNYYKINYNWNSFTRSKGNVIQQAEKINVVSTDDSVKLTQVLDKMWFILDNYGRIQKDETLYNDAIDLANGFASKYWKAIIKSETDSTIVIGSNNFIKVVEEYNPKFEEFREKAKKYFETPDPCPKNGNTITTNQQNQPSDNNSRFNSLLLWIAILFGLTGCVLGLLSLLYIKNSNSRIERRWNDEMTDLRKDLSKKINDIKPSSYRGERASSYIPPIPSQQSYQPRQQQYRRYQSIYDTVKQTRHEEPVTTHGPVRHEETAEKQINNKNYSKTYLYATVSARSPLPEFFKVTNENSNDKVFMLILSQPEADEAEFTLAPDMSQDFMKAVISDRETYLSPLFCEKSIDSVNPSTIIEVTKGKARKIDGKWQVQERLVIRLV